jgi:hypothetical protein
MRRLTPFYLSSGLLIAAGLAGVDDAVGAELEGALHWYSAAYFRVSGAGV